MYGYITVAMLSVLAKDRVSQKGSMYDLCKKSSNDFLEFLLAWLGKATPIGDYVSGPPPASFFGECEISEIATWVKCPH